MEQELATAQEITEAYKLPQNFIKGIIKLGLLDFKKENKTVFININEFNLFIENEYKHRNRIELRDIDKPVFIEFSGGINKSVENVFENKRDVEILKQAIFIGKLKPTISFYSIVVKRTDILEYIEEMGIDSLITREYFSVREISNYFKVNDSYIRYLAKKNILELVPNQKRLLFDYKTLLRLRSNQKIFTDFVKEFNLENQVLGGRSRCIKLGLESNLTVDNIHQMYISQNGLCFYCSIELGENFIIEHKTPIFRKGVNTIENVCLSCKNCNQRKGKKTDKEYFIYIEGIFVRYFLCLKILNKA